MNLSQSELDSVGRETCSNLLRILLYGIIRSIRPLGPLDGLMGGRFILVLLSIISILIAKGVYIAQVAAQYPNAIKIYNESAGAYERVLSLSSVILMIGLLFVPQLMLALVTTIGCSWSSITLIPYHPETLLLPSGTLDSLEIK